MEAAVFRSHCFQFQDVRGPRAKNKMPTAAGQWHCQGLASCISGICTHWLLTNLPEMILRGTLMVLNCFQDEV